MKQAEYNERQKRAMHELRKLKLLRPAQKWICKHRRDWEDNAFATGNDSGPTITPLEYALEEMPRFAILRWLGF